MGFAKAHTLFSQIIIIFIGISCVSSKLLIFKDTITFLRSEDFQGEIGDEPLDVIWIFQSSIRLEINSFHLNGHSGDFVLVSELPLLNENELTEKNSTSGDYVDLLAQSILTEQGILLSWITNKTIEAVTTHPSGTFVLYHAEPKPPDSTAEFKGFEIEVINYDDTRTTTSTTTDNPAITRRPGQEDPYISKFLQCNEPLEFFRNKDDFRNVTAKLATEYCRERNITLNGDIVLEDVNIPRPNEGKRAGVHYCDPTWPVYATCVEVTFAIDRLNTEGNYILPARHLEVMWREKTPQLQQHKYCPYTPPEAVADLNTIVWIAFFLGIILSLSALLAISWVQNTRILIEMGKTSKVPDEAEEKPAKDIFNQTLNPMYEWIFGNSNKIRSVREDNPESDARNTGAYENKGLEIEENFSTEHLEELEDTDDPDKTVLIERKGFKTPSTTLELEDYIST